MTNESDNDPTKLGHSERSVLIYSSSIVIKNPLKNDNLIQLVPIYKEEYHDSNPQKRQETGSDITRVNMVTNSRRQTEQLQQPYHQSPPPTDGSIGRKELCELWWDNCPYDCNAHLPSKSTSSCCDSYCKPVRQIVQFLSRRILSLVVLPSTSESTSSNLTTTHQRQKAPITIHPDCKCKSLVHFSANETNNNDPSITILIGKDPMKPRMVFRFNEVSSDKTMDIDNRAFVTPVNLGKRYAIANSTRCSRTTSSLSSANRKRSILPSSKAAIVTPVNIGTSSAAETKSTKRSASSNSRSRTILSTPRHNNHDNDNNTYWIESKKPSSSSTRSSSVSSKNNVSSRYERRKLLRRRIFDDSSSDETNDQEDITRLDDKKRSISSLRVSLLQNKYTDFLSMEIDKNSSSDESYNFTKRRLISRKRKRERNDIDVEGRKGKSGRSTTAKRRKCHARSNKGSDDDDHNDNLSVGSLEASDAVEMALSRRLNNLDTPKEDSPTLVAALSHKGDGGLEEKLSQHRSTEHLDSIKMNMNISNDATTDVGKTLTNTSNDSKRRTLEKSQYQRTTAHDFSTKDGPMKCPNSASSQFDSKKNSFACSKGGTTENSITTLRVAEMDAQDATVKPFEMNATLVLTQPDHDEFRRCNRSKITSNEVTKPSSSSTLFSNVTEDPPTPTNNTAQLEPNYLPSSMKCIMDEDQDQNTTKKPRNGLTESFLIQTEQIYVQTSLPVETKTSNEKSQNVNSFASQGQAKLNGSAHKEIIEMPSNAPVDKESCECVELLTTSGRANHSSVNDSTFSKDKHECLIVSKKSFTSDDPSTTNSKLDNGLLSQDPNNCDIIAPAKSDFQGNDVESNGDDFGSDNKNVETNKSACKESSVLSLPFPTTLDESQSTANQSSADSKQDDFMNNSDEQNSRKQPTLCCSNTLQDWIQLQQQEKHQQPNGCSSTSFRSAILELIVLKNRDAKSDQELWLPALFTNNTIIE